MGPFAGLMEKIMSKTNDTHKTNDTPKLGHGMLADSELDVVTGGTKAHQGKSQGSWFAAVATALGNQAAGALSR